MSSASLPSSKAQYNIIESAVGGGLALAILVIRIITFCIKRFCYSKESLHTLLSVFYFSFTVRQRYTNLQASNPQAGNVQLQAANPPATPPPAANPPAAPPQPANQPPSPILLIWTRNVPTGLNGCLAYTYYCSMTVMACWWFISYAVDNSVFLKMTMCSDINPNDMSHICFAVNESYKMVDCTAQQMEPVICYIFNLNIAGLGIAYSIATLCLSLTNVHYIILMKMTLKCPKCTIAFRVFVFVVLAVGGFIVWWVSFQTISKYNRYDYSGYGVVPMRVFQSCLALLTASIATMLAPCKWNGGQSYYDIAS